MDSIIKRIEEKMIVGKLYEVISGVYKGKIGMLLELDVEGDLYTFSAMRDELFECKKEAVKRKTIFG